MQIPDEIVRMGNIRFKGSIEGKRSFHAINGELRTDAGDAHMDLSLNGNTFHGIFQTGDIQIGHILNDHRLGNVKADIHAEGTIGKGRSNLPFNTLIAKGNIHKLDYNGYQYGTINIDGRYDGGKLEGLFRLDDPNGKVTLNGQIDLSGKVPLISATAKASQLNMKALHLTDDFGDRTFDLEAKADFSGRSLEQANGILDIRDFSMVEHGKAPVRIENLYVETGYHDQEHFINVQGDFGNMLLRGQYSYGTLPQSFINLIASKLPTLPGLPHAIRQSANDFAMIANISDATLLRSITGIPITLHQPLHLKSVVNDHIHEMEIDFDLPDFSYDDSRFKNAHANLTTRNDTLCSHAYINRMYDDGRKLSLELEAKAADNRLGTTLVWDTHGSRLLHGVLNAETEFFRTEEGQNAAHMRIHPSELYVDGNKWEVQPSDIIYSHKHLNIDQFQVSKGSQHLIVSGLATSSPKDSVNIDLQDIDVAYVLDLVDFHSVDFSGIASGRATLRNIFGTPEAYAQLKVQDFRFENGRMGTLHAHADYDVEEGQINIDAIADDLPSGQTLISGYVSPRKNYIDLGIMAHHSPLEFIRSFCSSFMGDVSVRGDGTCRVFGDLRKINLEGLMTATGTIEVTPLNTVYSLRKDTIRMIPDEIIFPSDTIYDRENHFAVVTGALHHKNLTNLTFDMSIDAQNFLSYDTHDYGDQTFFGTVYGTGTCDIKGRSGEISFDINATPDEGSFIEYNAAGPESISSAEFIHWESAHKQAAPYSSYDSMQDATVSQQAAMKNQTSDLRLNFLINTTPDFTLRVLMDETTGDRIDLNGEGMLRANYFNKGAFDLFGNYQVEHGTYTMTIQNVIKKAFTFQSGSSIIFGGDPFQAQLNLKGIYSLPAVSLSDLQMGRSFTQNNIRVNCLMDIGGTAGQPNVTFGLDLPTLSADARQMVQSVINSEEDMNQQVLYLLAVGRFLPQTGNNAIEDGTQQSQTSLAMQSILSGTISQQINTVLSNVVKSNNWNFGANISTGDEGFSNAEYEGLLSGRLLNNRLLINGEFGYRDNVTTDKGTSFIGDFDVQYLLYPNGNLAVKVYNQTNDRYFTRNSLTTQGIGIIMKKDFNTFRDLFRKKKKAKNGERNILNATTNKNEKSEK